MKNTKKLCIIASLFILIGSAIFGITLINQNYNIDKMFYEYDYQAKSYTNDLSSVNTIEIDLKEVNLNIKVSDNSQFKITYNEYENKPYKISNIENNLKISIDDKKWYEYLSFKLPLNNNATIYVPNTYSGEIKVFGDNVKIANELIENITVIE